MNKIRNIRQISNKKRKLIQVDNLNEFKEDAEISSD